MIFQKRLKLSRKILQVIFLEDEETHIGQPRTSLISPTGRDAIPIHAFLHFPEKIAHPFW
jgi:hypothetical protein